MGHASPLRARKQRQRVVVTAVVLVVKTAPGRPPANIRLPPFCHAHTLGAAEIQNTLEVHFKRYFTENFDPPKGKSAS